MSDLADAFSDHIHKIPHIFIQMSPMKILLMGYCLIILSGSLLLSLPFASRTSEGTAFSDALFTATSATCVTGLIRFDTFQHWTLFGQIVILCLIQIGGIGFMTVAISLISLTKRKIGLSTRFLMQESIAAPQLSGIIRMTKFVLLGTAMIEGTGALLLTFHFCPKFGFIKGVYYSIFHSVSAFCNAGFDLMGTEEAYSSLTAFSGNWYLNLIIMSLIVIGGLGFFVWQDILSAKFSFSKMHLHTKLVLTVTACLIISGALFFFLLELGGAVFQDLPVNERILTSLFQSVTCRTAGFNTVDLAQTTESSQFLMLCLMMIGGSTGSTAGGIKTTTFAVLIMSVFTIFRKKKNIEGFGRRMEEGVTRTASCVFTLYLFLSLFSAMIIAKIEGITLLSSLFECVSAIGTVGLTLGITPDLSFISKILLILLMLFGRVGSITMLLAFSKDRRTISSKLPVEKIQIG